MLKYSLIRNAGEQRRTGHKNLGFYLKRASLVGVSLSLNRIARLHPCVETK